MFRKIIYSFHIIFIFCSVDAFATIWDYNVICSFHVDSIPQNVTGSMKISDEFLLTEINDFDPTYYFDIISFSLTIEGESLYDFSGDGGGLIWIHQITDPQTAEKIYEEQWSISNSVSGDFWSQPFSASMEFFTSEMIPYKPTSNEYYGILAPTIALFGPVVATQYNSYSVSGGLIWLTRNSAPVPEPSVMALLGAGILASFLARRREKKPPSGI